MSTLLIIDDEPTICWAFREALEEQGHKVRVAASAEEALRATDRGLRPDAIVLDVRLPGADGLSLMPQMRERLGPVPMIVMTAFGNLETAVRSVELGAFDYLLKPFDLYQALAVIGRALERPAETPAAALARTDDESLIGSSGAMQQVFKKIALASASDVSVLITGESGTGKELVARALHRHSPRQQGVFLPICIPALNPGLVESELFGHARGAFTGATEDRTGLLELARDGTVLLDEVADIPPAVQVKLLRALEQREITRVGEARPRLTNLRILAATNRPLADLMQSGQFREDLYYRLAVFHIHLPPLRERRGDIPELAEHFLNGLRGSAPGLRLSPEAVKELTLRHWPGNVRELRNAVEHAAILARGGVVLAEHLPVPTASPGSMSTVEQQVQSRVANWATERTRAGSLEDLYEEFLKLVEPPLLESVLRESHDNRAAAAQTLGLHRATLRQKLRKYGLAAARGAGEPPETDTP